MNVLLKYMGDGVSIVKKGDEVWFNATDLAKILGYRDAENATRYLDDDEKDTLQECTPGGNQMMLFVNESGFYSLILKSEMPNAREFRRWVTHEVLPSIRKYGFYMDKTRTMNTMQIARLSGHTHNKALKLIADALPNCRRAILTGMARKGLDLDPIQTYLALTKLARGGVHWYIKEFPDHIQAIAEAFGTKYEQ